MSIKRKTYPLIVIALLILFSFSSACSAVYKCEDDFGRIRFSDEPCSRGESSTRVKGITSAAAKKRSPKREVKTSRKKIKSKEPVVLISLLTTTRLELKTASLSSSRGDESSQGIELVLPDGIKLDLTKVSTIRIRKSTRNNEIIAHIVMHDGFESIQTIPKPYPVISGDINIGRFSKSLQDIKTMEFFNSDKLPPKQKPDKIVNKPAAYPKNTAQSDHPDKQEVPVIELDLSEKSQSETTAKTVPGAKIKISAIPDRQNVSASTSISPDVITKSATVVPAKKPLPRPVKQSQNAHVTLVNDSHINLQKSTMASQRGKISAPQQLVLSNNVKISFKAIKQIKVRPTGDQSAIVVAVHLLTGEIKMENMSRPFTLVSGQSGSQHVSRSLLEIKSIHLQ